ncbi:MAG: hypothetical protein M5U23_03425 [Acidimicrobiia bacterium]|nr:hypothetical protein [Acidimicrobiia bacterium]
MSDPIVWFDRHGSMVTAAATIALVGVTVGYVVLTRSLVSESRKQAEAAQHSSELSALPVLTIRNLLGDRSGGNSYPVSFFLWNIGNGPALKVVATVIVGTDDALMDVWRETKFTLDIDPIQAGKPSPTEAERGGVVHSIYMGNLSDDPESGMQYYAVWDGAFGNSTPRWGIRVTCEDVFGNRFEFIQNKHEGWHMRALPTGDSDATTSASGSAFK